MFHLYPTDAPSVDSLQADLQLADCEIDMLNEKLLQTKLSQPGNTKVVVACVSLVAIGAVIAWKSPLGKKIRTKIVTAINPVESV